MLTHEGRGQISVLLESVDISFTCKVSQPRNNESEYKTLLYVFSGLKDTSAALMPQTSIAPADVSCTTAGRITMIIILKVVIWFQLANWPG